MHVALLCEFGTVNGGENSMLAMLEHLPEIEVTLLAPPSGRLADRAAAIGLRHAPFSLRDSTGRRLSHEAAVDQLQASVADLQPDLLHANSLSMGRLSGAAHDLLPVPTTAHLRDILRLNKSAIADLNRNDALLAVSRETRAWHLQQGLDPDRTHVLYNGIDRQRFSPRQATGWLHEELQIPRDAPLVATIGQITLRKGQDLFVAAAIETSRGVPTAHWLIIGERYSDKAETVALEQQMRRRIGEAGLTDRVHWLGYRDDIPQLLPELTLLVHSARQEPLGRVLLEAGACGVPIVATRVGGSAEILDDGVCGLLIPPDDVAAMAAAIEALLKDPQRRSSLGMAAVRRIAERFDVGPQARKVFAEWQRVVTAHDSVG